MPIQYAGIIFSLKKKWKISSEKKDIFYVLAQNKDCRFMLELPR